ncbi:MAG: T9SS type A sorting domain-containing protein [Bacteroidota bacterium]|nr:T9SS type A sorting domain-containing protein [Bacteroidota bacterium]
MKKTILILVVCLLCGYTFSQSISSQVIASAGEYSETSEIIVSWTLGEIAIETLESSTVILSQGFQQGYYEITSIEKLLENNVAIKVYPNPATDYIYISFESDEIKSVVIELYDLEGKIILKGKRYHSEGPYKINLSGLSSSQYFLRISELSGKTVETFKIIKR